MLAKALGFVICAIAMLLPWRLRVIYSDVLGWIVQFLYFTYYGILNYLLDELRKDKDKDKGKETGNVD